MFVIRLKHIAAIILIVLAVALAVSIYRRDPGQIMYHGCGLEGSASSPIVKQLNTLKNRSATPAAKDLNTAITLESMLASGKDTNRWSPNSAAEIQGYVYDVKPGGIESANCGAQNVNDRDTHIEIVTSLDDAGPTRRVIVEVTPRVRAAAASRGEDWTTQTLLGLRGRKVKVKGWMMFDFEHVDEAENTAPKRKENWRATAWEIHPITALAILQ